jgi:hypothetical protein
VALERIKPIAQVFEHEPRAAPDVLQLLRSPAAITTTPSDRS